MIAFLADENYDRDVVEELIRLGYDAVTVQERGKQGAPDSEVLALATSEARAVLTFDRRDYIRLHINNPAHSGIIVCTDDESLPLANRVRAAVDGLEDLNGQLVRITRPSN